MTLAGDITCYDCGCGFKNWKIIGDVLCRVKALVVDIITIQIPQRRTQKRINAQIARGEFIRKLNEVVNNLFKIAKATKATGFTSVLGRNAIMIIIFSNVLKMIEDMKKDKDQVDFESWINMCDDVVNLLQLIEI